MVSAINSYRYNGNTRHTLRRKRQSTSGINLAKIETRRKNGIRLTDSSNTSFLSSDLARKQMQVPAFTELNDNISELLTHYSGTPRTKPISSRLLQSLERVRVYANDLSDTELSASIYKYCKLPFVTETPYNYMDMMDPTQDTNMSKNIRMVEYIRMLCRVDNVDRVLQFKI